MKRVAIDCVPIRPGKGGTGSGIWTYARELVRHLDAAEHDNTLCIYVLINKEQTDYFPRFERLRPVVFPNYARHVIARLLWIHLILPLWCVGRRIHALHKLASETPWFCPARRITTVHDFYHEFMTEQAGTRPRGTARYFAAITRRAFEKSVVILTDSRTVHDEARKRFPQSTSDMRVAPIGVTTPDDNLERAFKRDGLFRILVVAKFMPYKGQLHAVAAFEQLNDPKARLVLHGFANDTAFVTELDQRIAASPQRAAIERRDYQPSADLDDLYAEADVLLFLSQYEGFGLPVIEAQARSIPVVCSDIPVLREVGGDGALYVDRDNPQEIADALRRLRDDDAFRRDLVAKGRENAKRFSWQQTARQTLEAYLACVSR